MKPRLVPTLLVIALAGCAAESPAIDAGIDAGADAGPPDAGPPLPFELTSTAFEAGARIPLRYECGPPPVPDGPGENVTPPRYRDPDRDD